MATSYFPTDNNAWFLIDPEYTTPVVRTGNTTATTQTMTMQHLAEAQRQLDQIMLQREAEQQAQAQAQARRAQQAEIYRQLINTPTFMQPTVARDTQTYTWSSAGSSFTVSDEDLEDLKYIPAKKKPAKEIGTFGKYLRAKGIIE